MPSPLARLMAQSAKPSTQHSVYVGVERTVDSVKEPVTLADAKNWGKIDLSDDDVLGLNLLTAARQHIEEYIKKSLITQTRKLTLEWFPSDDYVDLPFRPIQSVTSITTYDDANSSTVMPSDQYTLDAVSGRVYLNNGFTWPTDLRPHNGVEIVYVAGYGDDPEDVPMAIRQALVNTFSAWYDERNAGELPPIVSAILDNYREKRL